jgi:hypothetical protein
LSDIDMAWLFNATGHDVIAGTALASNTFFSNAAGQFCAFWMYLNTFADDERLVGHGTTNGLRILASGQMRYVWDRATTDSVWESTGTALTTGKWWFIGAFGCQRNSTLGQSVRMYVGDLETPPQLVTTSETVLGSGNVSGSNAITIGNSATGGTAAPDGWLGNVVVGVSASTSLGFSPYTLPTITDTEAELFRDYWLVPIWRGDLSPVYLATKNTGGSFAVSCISGDTITGTRPNIFRPDGSAITGADASVDVANIDTRCPQPWQARSWITTRRLVRR